MPNKLTDSEIVKALEQCEIQQTCSYCPYFEKLGCKKRLYKDTLNLINRLQEENKRSKADVGTLESKMITLNALIEMKNDTIANQFKVTDELERQLKTAKAEAYKEFAERLKKEAFKINYCGSSYNVVDTDDINNLLKEMVGE